MMRFLLQSHRFQSVASVLATYPFYDPTSHHCNKLSHCIHPGTKEDWIKHISVEKSAESYHLWRTISPRFHTLQLGNGLVQPF